MTTSGSASSDRFQLGRQLGQGAFGTVFEAWDAKLGRQVALKQLRHVEATTLLRFKREFRYLADVNHPNLIKLGDLVATGDIWFFTMELIAGRDLLAHVWFGEGEASDSRTFVSGVAGSESLTLEAPTVVEGPKAAAAERRRQRAMRAAPSFDEDRLRHSFGQLAVGVHALHERDLLHRDLKPSNVMVTGEGRVVILDFGLVADVSLDQPADSSRVVGTPAYMSPEQALGEGVTAASDWYGVGVMLYEALTGRRPATAFGVAGKEIPEAPRPGRIGIGVPADLDQLCHELLDRDPERRPPGEEIVQRLAAGVRSGRGSEISEVRPSFEQPFVGRRQQLETLDEALDGVHRGESGTVFVTGISGMGKSALIEHFLSQVRLRHPDALVLSGRCYQRESVPYKAFDNVVDELSRFLERQGRDAMQPFLPRDLTALGTLFPVLRNLEKAVESRRTVPAIPDATELRRRAFSALRELLARIADQYIVVLYIDDLQWGDLDSGALLRELMRPPDAPPLLLVASYRSEEASRSALLQMLDTGIDLGERTWEVGVGQLPEEEARELALAAIGGYRPGDQVKAEAIARESGGNPFFLGELARYYLLSGGDDLRLPSLETLIRARADDLPAGARRLLEMVAIAGEPIDLGIANTAADLLPLDHDTIELLQQGQWVRPCALEDREAFEAFHDRIRETLTALVPDDQRPSRHLRIATAWEAAGTAKAATLAEHFEAAQEFEAAGRYALEGADEAARELAFDRAARLYAKAHDVGHWQTEELHTLRSRRAEALANADRGELAARAYLEAAEIAEPAEILDHRRRAAEQFLISGHIDDGQNVLMQVLDSVGLGFPPTPARLLVSLGMRRLQATLRGTRFKAREAAAIPDELLTKVDVCWAVGIGFGMVDTVRGSYFQTLSLLWALRSGEPFRIARSLSMEYAFSSTGGTRTLRRTEKLRQQCAALVAELDDPYLDGLFAIEDAIAGNLSGRYTDSLEAARLGEQTLRERCTGVTWEIDTAQIYRNHALANMGLWRALGERVPPMLEDARERGDLYLLTYLRTRNVYLLHLVDDRLEEARAEQDRSLDGWSQRSFQLEHYWDWFARGEIDLYAGAPHAVWESVNRTWRAFERSLLPRVQGLHLEAVFLRARAAVALAARTASPNEADELLRRATRDAGTLEKSSLGWADAMAAIIRASAEVTRGDRRGARTLLRGAAAGFRKHHLPQFEAAANWRLGELAAGEDSAAAAAHEWMEGQAVKAPERMVDMLAPGRWVAA